MGRPRLIALLHMLLELPSACSSPAGPLSVAQRVVPADTGTSIAALNALRKSHVGEYAGVPGVDDDGNGVVDDFYGGNFIHVGAPTADCSDDSGHGSSTSGAAGGVNDGNSGTSLGVSPKVGCFFLLGTLAIVHSDGRPRGPAVLYASCAGLCMQRTLGNSAAVQCAGTPADMHAWACCSWQSLVMWWRGSL